MRRWGTQDRDTGHGVTPERGITFVPCPRGLKRYQQAGDLHFITFSCFGVPLHVRVWTCDYRFQPCAQLLAKMGQKGGNPEQGDGRCLKRKGGHPVRGRIR